MNQRIRMTVGLTLASLLLTVTTSSAPMAANAATTANPIRVGSVTVRGLPDTLTARGTKTATGVTYSCMLDVSIGLNTDTQFASYVDPSGMVLEGASVMLELLSADGTPLASATWTAPYPAQAFRWDVDVCASRSTRTAITPGTGNWRVTYSPRPPVDQTKVASVMLPLNIVTPALITPNPIAPCPANASLNGNAWSRPVPAQKLGKALEAWGNPKGGYPMVRVAYSADSSKIGMLVGAYAVSTKRRNADGATIYSKNVYYLEGSDAGTVWSEPILALTEEVADDGYAGVSRWRVSPDLQQQYATQTATLGTENAWQTTTASVGLLRNAIREIPDWRTESPVRLRLSGSSHALLASLELAGTASMATLGTAPEGEAVKPVIYGISQDCNAAFVLWTRDRLQGLDGVIHTYFLSVNSANLPSSLASKTPAKLSVRTIRCVKGRMSKLLKGLAPKCPAGWKRKS